jgi:hypothetical protein
VRVRELFDLDIEVLYTENLASRCADNQDSAPSFSDRPPLLASPCL